MKKISVKLRIRPPQRRTPAQRLKSRLYYRKHRAKIRLQRKKYLRQHKFLLKNRKLLKRFKPVWYRRKQPTKTPKPHLMKKFRPNIPSLHLPQKKHRRK